ncbi:MAG TPA: T9SS type A sorting domain-containing protein, partial [Bacteroidia bacterium]
ADIVQGHRVYYDTTYSYPGANGVKTTSPSGWDNTITQEYVFGRVNKWLNQYMGPNHGVTCAVSEFGLTNNNANVTANSYSSILGTFADNGVEFFTPWYWYPGMWETLHLFSRYAKNIRVKSVSTNELDVSAYSSINSTNDSMTVILVNRALTTTHATTVNLANFTVQNGTYSTKQISNLPSTETFVSHTNNALISGTVTATTNTFSISLPALSTTAIILKGQAQTSTNELSGLSDQISIFPNPSNGSFTIENSISDILGIEIFNLTGEKIYSLQEPAAHLWSVPIDLSSHASGIYFVQVKTNTGTAVKKLFLNKK